MAKKKEVNETALFKKEFHDILACTNNDLACVASEGKLVGDTADFINTGSFILNAQFSGSMYGGVPGNRITIFAGEESTGKTFYTLGIVKAFLDASPNNFVVIFETEAAVSHKMLTERGIDISRIGVVPVVTVETFRNQAVKVLDKAIESKKSDKPMRFMFVLDSIGNLTTEKLQDDVRADKNTKDMTRPGTLKGAFGLLALKLAAVNAPMIATNHVYDVIGEYYARKEMGGGSGPKYNASSVAFLSTSKAKDADKNVTGSIIKVHLKKSRFTREETKVVTLLDFTKGLNAYYGLTEFGLSEGIFTKDGNKVVLSNGMTAFESTINANPEKYFTEDVMALLEITCRKAFSFGSAMPPETVVEEVPEAA